VKAKDVEDQEWRMRGRYSPPLKKTRTMMAIESLQDASTHISFLSYFGEQDALRLNINDMIAELRAEEPRQRRLNKRDDSK
jgi:hypothetical protein